MPLNIPVEILRLPGTKVTLTLDFGLWSKVKRTNLRNMLKRGYLPGTNEVAKLVRSTPGLRTYYTGYSCPIISTLLFDTEAAQEELNLFTAHRRLVNPDREPVVTFRNGFQGVIVETNEAKIFNLYDTSQKYRAAVKPIMQAVIEGRPHAFEVTE